MAMATRSGVALGLLVAMSRVARTASLLDPTRPLQIRKRATTAYETTTRTLATLRASRALLARSEVAVEQLAPKLLEDARDRARLMGLTFNYLNRELEEAPERVADEQFDVLVERLQDALNLRKPGRLMRLGKLVRVIGYHATLLVRPRPLNRLKEQAAQQLLEAQAAYDDAELRATKIGRIYLDGMRAQLSTRIKGQQLDGLIESAELNLDASLQRIASLERTSQALQALRARALQREAELGGDGLARLADGGSADGDADHQGPSGAMSTEGASEQLRSGDDAFGEGAVSGEAPEVLAVTGYARAASSEVRSRRPPRQVVERVDRWLCAVCERYEEEPAQLDAMNALLVAAVERAEKASTRSELERFTAVKGLKEVRRDDFSAFLYKGKYAERRREQTLAVLGIKPDETHVGLSEEQAAQLGAPRRKPPLLIAAVLHCLAACRKLVVGAKELFNVTATAEWPTLERVLFDIKLAMFFLPILTLLVKTSSGFGYYFRYVYLRMFAAEHLARQRAVEAWIIANPQLWKLWCYGSVLVFFLVACKAFWSDAGKIHFNRVPPEYGGLN